MRCLSQIEQHIINLNHFALELCVVDDAEQSYQQDELVRAVIADHLDVEDLSILKIAVMNVEVVAIMLEIALCTVAVVDGKF